VIGRSDLCATTPVVCHYVDRSDLQAERPGDDSVARLMIGRSAGISLGMLHVIAASRRQHRPKYSAVPSHLLPSIPPCCNGELIVRGDVAMSVNSDEVAAGINKAVGGLLFAAVAGMTFGTIPWWLWVLLILMTIVVALLWGALRVFAWFVKPAERHLRTEDGEKQDASWAEWMKKEKEETEWKEEADRAEAEWKAAHRSKEQAMADFERDLTNSSPRTIDAP
jgi:hypothetical protein